MITKVSSKLYATKFNLNPTISTNSVVKKTRIDQRGRYTIIITLGARSSEILSTY